MPYIKKERRQALWQFNIPEHAGELNFMITSILTAYLTKHGKSYSSVNDILGALEGAKLEFYRRVAVPYENNKITENGDVYE